MSCPLGAGMKKFAVAGILFCRKKGGGGGRNGGYEDLSFFWIWEKYGGVITEVFVLLMLCSHKEEKNVPRVDLVKNKLLK